MRLGLWVGLLPRQVEPNALARLAHRMACAGVVDGSPVAALGHARTMSMPESSYALHDRVTHVLSRARDVLLVGGGRDDPRRGLPGGGVEPGEDEVGALRRELHEEAAAPVLELQRLGAQRVDDPDSGSEYHAFYWRRVSLAEEYAPTADVFERVLVSPDAFLDALFWGRSDPKAATARRRALQRCLDAHAQGPSSAVR